MKKRILAVLLALVMVISVISPSGMVVQAANYVTVTMSVEKFVIGQGYIVEPTRLQIKKGADVSDVFEKVMKDAGREFTLSTYGYYIDAIKDPDRGELNVSDTLKTALLATLDWNGNPLTLEETDLTPDFLGSYDYCSYAGWMYSVNNVFPDDAMDGYTVSNGDVIRVQFSLTGGSDINPQYAWGTPIYPEMADRTQITRVYGFLNQQIAADQEYLVKKNLVESYQNGLSLIYDFSTTSEQMQAAVAALDTQVQDLEVVIDDVKVHTVKKTTNAEIKTARQQAMTSLKKSTKAAYGNEWNIFTLKRANATGCKSLYDNYLKNLGTTLRKNKGLLPNGRPTDYARVCITLTALGKNPKNFNGYNVMKPLGNYDAVCKQGLNAAIYSLIAFDAGKYLVPEINNTKAQATRMKYVDFILSKQLSDGGFAFTGNKADADMTAMAITALAPYSEKYKKVAQSIDKAIDALSQMQQSNGSFYSGTSCNAESNAQVIVALTSVGINPRTDARFIKNGRSVVAALMSFKTSTGGFKHLATGKTNALATTQAGTALVAYQLFLTGKKPLYRIK